MKFCLHHMLKWNTEKVATTMKFCLHHMFKWNTEKVTTMTKFAVAPYLLAENGAQDGGVHAVVQDGGGAFFGHQFRKGWKKRGRQRLQGAEKGRRC